MSESPRTSGYPGLSSAGHPEAGDSGLAGNSRRQEWDQRQPPRRSIAEAVNAPLQFPPPHPESHPIAQGQLPVSMPAQRSPFVAQAAFPPPRAPKRPKAHVLSACVNCKKAHLSCDVWYSFLPLEGSWLDLLWVQQKGQAQRARRDGTPSASFSRKRPTENLRA
ncbi:MAG: hypothetical protein M1840_003213 [Geoglossum simile]|nr:MAG: hypothetical protein M1840_003213 [Geoglossum simile]